MDWSWTSKVMRLLDGRYVVQKIKWRDKGKSKRKSLSLKETCNMGKHGPMESP